METTVKPYTLVVSIPGVDNMLGLGASSISLTDTTGALVECNWVECKPLTHTPGETYLLGCSSAALADGIVIHDISAGTSSYVGCAGSMDLRLDEGTELYLADSRRITSVEIGHSAIGTVKVFILTYGYRRPNNPLRASGRSDGK